MDTVVMKNEKTHKKLGFDKKESSEIVKKMNLLIANYHVHYQKLRNFHWNVTGPDFFDIHEKTEELYDEAKLNIDELAERIRVFGHTPFSTMKDYLGNAEIKEVGTDMEAEEMVKEILTDFEILLSFFVELNEAATANGDIGTRDLINPMIKGIEKNHWMLTAFIS